MVALHGIIETAVNVASDHYGIKPTNQDKKVGFASGWYLALHVCFYCKFFPKIKSMLQRTVSSHKYNKIRVEFSVLFVSSPADCFKPRD